jgi:cytochrome P450 PksS
MSQSSTTPQKYDLLAPEALVNPYPLYQKIRSEDPVYFYEKGGFWFLTRHKDVEAGFQDTRLSSDRQGFADVQLQTLDLSKIQNYSKLMSTFMVEKDPPIHTKLRKIAQPGLTAKALENWQVVIQNLVDNLLDQIENKQNIELVNDLALELPATVISKIFNVPDTSRKDFVQWGLDIVRFWGFSGSENVGEIAQVADQAALNFMNFVEELVVERQQHPGDDMISLLIAASQEHGVSLEFLPSTCFTILTAGHTTTSDVICNGLYALLTHPQQWQMLKEHPELINTAIEELIRFDPPVQMLFRVAKENLMIGGKEIKAGEMVALGIGAANRDPEKFHHPETLDITRSPNEHLGFGKGIHFCLGAILARMELKACFSTLLRRMPNLMLDPDNTPVVDRDYLLSKGFKSLPLKF